MRALFAMACLASACGRLAFEEHDAPAVDALGVVTWGPPQPMPPSLQSPEDDWEASLSPDGMTLVFASARTGLNRIYVATRDDVGWTAPMAPAALNPGETSSGPVWNASGDRLYFAADPSGVLEIHVSAFAAGVFEPAVVPAGLADVPAVAPWISADECELLFTTPVEFDEDLMVAVRPSIDDAWGAAVPIAELNTSSSDGWPTMLPDERTIYFEHTGPEGNTAILAAVRSERGAPFGPPVILPSVDDPTAEDGDPEVTRDGAMLLLGSDRAGTTGESDLFVSLRE